MARKEVVGFVQVQKRSVSLHVFVEHLGRVSMKIYLSTQTELQQVMDDQREKALL